MKKIFSTVALVFVALFLCVSISATDITAADTSFVEEDEFFETEIESVADETVDGDLTESEGTLHTYWSRLWEYVITHKQELLTTCGDVVLVILTLFIRSRTGKKTAEIEKTVNCIEDYTKATNGSQISVVGAVNGMIDGYNSLKISYDKYGETEADRNRIVGALVATNTAMLEILTTVYANSKNLPQGVKDIVMLQYANCLKALDDDEQLKSIVRSVREGINANLIKEPTGEVTTEVGE